MGYLKRGTWIVEEMIPKASADGEFKRGEQKFRHQISKDTPYPPERGRYHLYVSYACPWATRTLIMRQLKGLQNEVSVSVVHPHALDYGWSFVEDFAGVVPDGVLGKKFLYEIYAASDPDFSGKVTVPVLFDKSTRSIVNNESSEILRILNQSFLELGADPTDYYPKEHRQQIDALNSDIYENINNGVYRVGFAQTQEAYDKNLEKLFEALDRIEAHLAKRSFLVAETLTEADIRLFVTLVRFDCVYHGHFKCNLKMIRDYPALSSYLKRLMDLPAFRENTHFDHIREHYYFSHKQINPTRIVPRGPSCF